MLGEQAARRIEAFVITDFVVSGFDVNGNQFADIVFRLDLGAQTLLIEFFPASADLLAAKTWGWHRGTLLSLFVPLLYFTTAMQSCVVRYGRSLKEADNLCESVVHNLV